MFWLQTENINSEDVVYDVLKYLHCIKMYLKNICKLNICKIIIENLKIKNDILTM